MIDYLLSFDNDNNPRPTLLYCFKSEEDAKEFMKMIMCKQVHAEMLMNPVMVLYDGTKETKDSLDIDFQLIFYSGEKE